MRLAALSLAMCLACRDDGPPRDPNPNLTVEPISIDAGVVHATAKAKHVGMGDHRRREDDDMREYRRRKAARAERPAEDVATAHADAGAEARKAEEERRHEAERQHMTNVPLEVYTNPTGQTTEIPTR